MQSSQYGIPNSRNDSFASNNLEEIVKDSSASKYAVKSQ